MSNGAQNNHVWDKLRTMGQAIFAPLVLASIAGGFNFWHQTDVALSEVNAHLHRLDETVIKLELRATKLEQHASDHQHRSYEIESKIRLAVDAVKEQVRQCFERAARLEEQVKLKCIGRRRDLDDESG